MKIEVWSDFVCPFCYIGKHRLEQALASIDHNDQVEVVYRSFELDPGMDMHHLLARKYGMSLEQAKAANANVGRQAAEIGLEFRFDTMKPTNSFDAHRLNQWAQEKGAAADLAERLFKASFTDSLHIGDRQTLAELAEALGLDKEEALEVLASEAFTEEVRADEQEARQLGIQGVPFFVMNRKFAVSGAQPLEVFQDALHKAGDSANVQ